jgi:hypothetical protein
MRPTINEESDSLRKKNLLRRLHCCFFNLQNTCFKHFVISQKLLGQSTWMSTRCAQQVGLRRLHCRSSICKNKCLKHFVISQKLLGQSTWESTRCAQQVGLRRLHCCSSFARITVLNILSYLRNYWANRPACQRVVLSRLGCAYYYCCSSICKNNCFKHFVISQKLLGQSTWGSTRSAQQVGMRRRKFFSRRQSDSSLIVGRIIDPRPGLYALPMDLVIPCVTHWCTWSITPRCSSSITCRKMNDLLCDAIVNPQTCFSGSENTQELLLRV